MTTERGCDSCHYGATPEATTRDERIAACGRCSNFDRWLSRDIVADVDALRSRVTELEDWQRRATLELSVPCEPCAEATGCAKSQRILVLLKEAAR